MPLLLQKEINESTKLAIWDSQEELDFFREALKLDTEELKCLSEMRLHRQREWLSSRYLLYLLLNEKSRTKLVKDACGKPHLNKGKAHISISHSKTKVAVIVSDRPTGIDVQERVERIPMIQHKFISEEEGGFIDASKAIDYYHIFWGAKESMYKAYGLKELDFKLHMYLYPFQLFDSKIEFVGHVKKGETHQDYDLYFELLNETYLVYCLKKN